MKWTLLFIVFVLNTAAGQNTISFLNPPRTNYLFDASPAISTNAVIPIELVRGMVYVKAELEGVAGHFILDTGAPTLVVNRKPTEKNGEKARGLNKELLVSWIQVKDFRWAGLSKNNVTALAVDISHLEKAANRKILGMIGFDLIQQYELFFDYQAGAMIYYPSGVNPLHKATKPLASIPFELQGHVPVISVKVGDRVLALGVDTGAASNLLDENLFQSLSADTHQSREAEQVQGLDQSIQSVKSSNFSSILIGKTPFENIPFLFTDLHHLQVATDLRIDGLLGTPLLERLKFSIDYPGKMIHIWEVR